MKYLVILITITFVGMYITTVSRGGDLDCDDFKNQQQAQKEFERYSEDVHNLDRNNNLIACEV